MRLGSYTVPATSHAYSLPLSVPRRGPAIRMSRQIRYYRGDFSHVVHSPTFARGGGSKDQSTADGCYHFATDLRGSTLIQRDEPCQTAYLSSCYVTLDHFGFFSGYLKIRVSAVQFCPWPPIFQGLAALLQIPRRCLLPFCHHFDR